MLRLVVARAGLEVERVVDVVVRIAGLGGPTVIPEIRWNMNLQSTTNVRFL